jgi:outer membrane protein OmpA-like peptidoglycan-associated protein
LNPLIGSIAQAIKPSIDSISIWPQKGGRMNTVANSYGEGSGRASSSSSTRTTGWIRRDYPVMPFVWWGLLPLLGLLALLWYGFMPFARQTIEQQVRSQTQAMLTQAGHGWVKMAVSGQHVTLSGTPPAAGSGDQALAVARAATCSTWTGQRVCAVDVVGDFAQVAAAPTPTPTPAAPAAPAPVAAAQQCETNLAALLADRKIEFATSKATVLASSKPLLDEIAKAAKDCPGVIEVQGHTDSRGSADMNKALSQARADAVVQALRERGFEGQRLKGSGFGPDKPIGDNNTSEGRAQNRRIEFRVIAN